MRVAILVFAAAVGGMGGAHDEARAWGKLGHLTVCDLAYRNLTDTSRQAVRELMRTNRGGITVRGRGKLPDRHYTAFNAGCLEEDELPRRNPNDHFINLPRNSLTVPGEICPPEAGGGQCILAGIRRDWGILKDRSRSPDERVFALMALGHWIGDIHQPLHVSFADDRGGNGIDARVQGRCGSSSYRPDNLHAVWDNCLLESGMFERVRQRADYRRSWGPRTITYRAVDTLQANTDVGEELAMVQGQPWQWAAHSFTITLNPAVRYCVRIGANCAYSPDAVVLARSAPRRFEQFDQTYLQAFERTAQEQIRKAGFRLAHLLNQALDAAYAGPIRNSGQPR